jgi:hypothetical protein
VDENICCGPLFSELCGNARVAQYDKVDAFQ